MFSSSINGGMACACGFYLNAKFSSNSFYSWTQRHRNLRGSGALPVNAMRAWNLLKSKDLVTRALIPFSRSAKPEADIFGTEAFRQLPN